MISFACYQPLAVMLSGLIYGFLELCVDTKYLLVLATQPHPKKGLAEKCPHLWLTALEKINIFWVCIFYYKTWTYSVKQHPFFFQLRLLAQCVKATLAEFPANFQICNFPCISRALFSAENILRWKQTFWKRPQGSLNQVLMLLVVSDFSDNYRQESKRVLLIQRNLNWCN